MINGLLPEDTGADSYGTRLLAMYNKARCENFSTLRTYCLLLKLHLKLECNAKLFCLAESVQNFEKVDPFFFCL